MKKSPAPTAQSNSLDAVPLMNLADRFGLTLPPLTVFNTGNLLDLSPKAWAAFSEAATGHYRHPFIQACIDLEWMSFNHFDYKGFTGQDAANLFTFIVGMKNLKRMVFGFFFPPAVVQSPEYQHIRNMGIQLMRVESVLITNMFCRLHQFENLTELYLDGALRAEHLQQRRKRLPVEKDLLWLELGCALEECTKLQVLSLRDNQIAQYPQGDVQSLCDAISKASSSLLLVDLNQNGLFRANGATIKALTDAMLSVKSLLSYGLYQAESLQGYAHHLPVLKLVNLALAERQVGYHNIEFYFQHREHYEQTKAEYWILPMAFSYLMVKLFYGESALSSMALKHGYNFSFVKFSEYYDQQDYATALTLYLFGDFKADTPNFETEKEGVRQFMIAAIQKENDQLVTMLAQQNGYSPEYSSIFWQLGMNKMALCDFREAFYAFRNAERLVEDETSDFMLNLRTNQALLDHRNRNRMPLMESLFKAPLQIIYYTDADSYKESRLYPPVPSRQARQPQPNPQQFFQSSPVPSAPPLYDEVVYSTAPPTYEEAVEQPPYWHGASK